MEIYKYWWRFINPATSPVSGAVYSQSETTPPHHVWDGEGVTACERVYSYDFPFLAGFWGVTVQCESSLCTSVDVHWVASPTTITRYGEHSWVPSLTATIQQTTPCSLARLPPTWYEATCTQVCWRRLRLKWSRRWRNVTFCIGLLNNEAIALDSKVSKSFSLQASRENGFSPEATPSPSPTWREGVASLCECAAPLPSEVAGFINPHRYL